MADSIGAGSSLANVRVQAPTGEALVLLIGDAERRLTRRLATILVQHDCTVERWRALNLLAPGDSHRMSELAEFTQLPPASLTRLIDGMVTDNLVHRKADPRDRRSVLVHITDRGLALQARLSEQIAAEQLLGDADERELGALADALAGLIERLR
jgi:DNA-binding MarR family transcriptional regulator